MSSLGVKKSAGKDKEIDTNESKENDNTICLKWNKKDIDKYDTFIFDCDGVVWLSKDAIPGAKETLQTLRKLNKQIIFLSNNSSKDLSMYQSKFKQLFDYEAKKNQIFTSAVAATSYISILIPKIKQYLEKLSIVLIGSEALYNMISTEIKSQKYENVSIIWTRNLDLKLSVPQLADLKLDENAAIVCVGIDWQYGYGDIALVTRYLHEMKHKVHLIGTNEDQTYPAKPGIVLAGTGSLLASIRSVSPIEMKVCGKPQKLLLDLIKEKHKSLDVNKCLMVGDRLGTDIVFGINSGMDTALVMTGITTETVLEKSEIKPMYKLDSIKDLIQ